MTNAIIDQILNSIVFSLTKIIQDGIAFIPRAIGAFILLIVGYLIALIIGDIIKEFSKVLKLDKWLEEKNPNVLGGFKISYIIGELVKWWIFISFLPAAADLLALPSIQNLVLSFVTWFPKFVISLIIFITGLIVADFISSQIKQNGKKVFSLIREIVRYSIVIFFISIALREAQIDISLAENTFLIIIGGITLSISIVLGIVFGFSMRKYADKFIKKIMREEDGGIE